jgi:hypothetical protein
MRVGAEDSIYTAVIIASGFQLPASGSQCVKQQAGSWKLSAVSYQLVTVFDAAADS